MNPRHPEEQGPERVGRTGTSDVTRGLRGTRQRGGLSSQGCHPGEEGLPAQFLSVGGGRHRLDGALASGVALLCTARLATSCEGPSVSGGRHDLQP